MKILSLAAALLFSGGVLSAAVIAEWDFTKGLKSSDGKFELKIRDAKFAQQTPEGLVCIDPGKDVNAGVTAVKRYAELTPAGAFELEMTFKPDFSKFFPNTKRKEAVLFDSKYYFNTKPGSKKSFNSGFLVRLRFSKNSMQPAVFFGYGDHTTQIAGKAIKIEDGKLYTLLFRYDPAGFATFIWDDKNKNTVEFEGGKIAPAVRSVVIGDRISSTRSPFAGVIKKAALRTAEPVKVKAVEMSQANQEVPDKPALQPVPEGYKTVAEWNFKNTLHNTAKKNELKLRGATKLVQAGDSGALQINAPAKNVISKASGAEVKGGTRLLSPAGKFRLQMLVMLDAKQHVVLKGREKMLLFDSKYQESREHKGMIFELVDRGDKAYRMSLNLGFGKKSASASSGVFYMDFGKWYELAVDFDAEGMARFYCNGKFINKFPMPYGTMATAGRTPVFGDRISSGHRPFEGFIGAVRMSTKAANNISVTRDFTRRGAFIRGEQDKKLYFNVHTRKAEVKNLKVAVSSPCGFKKDFAVESVKPGEPAEFALDINTTLLPGDYAFDAAVTDAAGKVLAENKLEYHISEGKTPNYPVMMWGGDITSRLKAAGFTHTNTTFTPISGEYTAANKIASINSLDNSLKSGVWLWERIYGKYRFVTKKRYLRTRKDGKTWNALEASHPEVIAEFSRVASDTAKSLGEHPAWTGVLSNSEIRGNSGLSWGGVEPENFRKAAGFDIPKGITGRGPLPHTLIDDFPWDRVIKRNSPEMIFYRWIWKDGDGWNPLHTAITEAYHKHIKRDNFLTFYDPVTRVPPLWGSGGGVDAINQWTYTNPDPIKIGQATDEVIAMAQGRPGQKIYSMTQAIWYRSASAPKNKKVENMPDWVNDEPNASYISIPEDALSIALWSKISRRLDGIMYHGSGSLLTRGIAGGYRLTNRAAAKRLAELNKSVILPLGAILPKVKERPVKVGILESFASALYAPRHFSSGWSRNWVADIHLALSWANLQTGILYEEHLLDEKFIKDLKVLVLPGMEVVDEVILEKLRELRKKGVILVGDEFTAPAIMVDVRIKSFRRDNNDPAGSKKALQALGMKIRNAIAAGYKVPVAATSQDLVVRRRGCDKADYVFVLNDKRTFGDYMGQWRLVMEKGLPLAGKITVNHPAKAAYDLVKHQPVALKQGKNAISFDVDLAAGDGTLVLLLEKPIASVAIKVPAAIEKGKAFKFDICVLDSAGQPVKACLPLEVTLTDVNGKRLPGSGFYAAEKGVLEFKEIAAANIAGNSVKVTVKCLASGKTAAGTITVK